MRKALLFIWLFCAHAYIAKALTEADIKADFVKHVMKCTKDHPVDTSEMVALHNWVVPTKMEVLCLLACAYKLEGIMTAEGLYDKEHAYAIAKLAENGDEMRLVNGKKVADICVQVNEVEVTDGEKGCERARLIFKCVVENAPKHGFILPV